MAIGIGENMFILKEDIIAVIDNKTILKSKDGRALLKRYEKDLLVHKIEKEIKTYVLALNGGNLEFYESNISSASIKNKFKSKGLKELDD